MRLTQVTHLKKLTATKAQPKRTQTSCGRTDTIQLRTPHRRVLSLSATVAKKTTIT